MQDDSYAPAAASSMSEWFAFVSAYRISRCLRSPVVDIDSRESLISNSWSACPLVGSDSLTMRNDFTSPCLATPNRYHGSAIYKNSPISHSPFFKGLKILAIKIASSGRSRIWAFNDLSMEITGDWVRLVQPPGIKIGMIL